MITYEALRNQVLKLADEHPDAVYHGRRGVPGAACSYVWGEAAGRGGCLFGQALSDLGVGCRLDGINGADRWPGVSISGVLDDLNVACTDDQVQDLVGVQQIQDSGMCWADAVQPLRDAR